MPTGLLVTDDLRSGALRSATLSDGMVLWAYGSQDY